MSYNSRCSCVRSDQCHAHIPRSCICSLETVRLDHEAERLCWCRTSNAGTDVHGPTEPVPQHPSNTSRDAAVLTDFDRRCHLSRKVYETQERLDRNVGGQRAIQMSDYPRSPHSPPLLPVSSLRATAGRETNCSPQEAWPHLVLWVQLVVMLD